MICASPNEIIVHGIPNGRRLDEGDIVSIDCGAIVDGWHGDAAFTTGVGKISVEAARLIEAAEQALLAGMARLVPGGRLSDVGAAVQCAAEDAGFDVVREYVGHGIGEAMHEAPDVPNYGRPGRGPRLRAGQTFAVEPMLVAGSPDSEVLADGWTVRTLDGSLAAHVEHTLVVTDDGPGDPDQVSSSSGLTRRVAVDAPVVPTQSHASKGCRESCAGSPSRGPCVRRRRRRRRRARRSRP